MKTKYNTREEWLNQLVQTLRPRYGKELPKTVHISVGFPSRGIRSKSIGECWHGEASADKAPQVFIHPGLSDPVDVAAVVVHELIHACRPDAKHGAGFKALAVPLGLEGRMTATHASEGLREDLSQVCKEFGAYPHPALSGGKSSAKPKQTTRMLKVSCGECGYTVRTTAKWLEVGYPVCPCGTEMVS